MTNYTVTATATNNTFTGGLLKVYVLDNAAIAGTPAVGSSITAYNCSVTTTVAGSFVYGIALNDTASTAFTAEANTTISDDQVVNAGGAEACAYHTTAGTGTPQPTVVGATTTFAGNSGTVAMEILASGGTQSIDASSPAVVFSTTLTSFQTASFSPPAGSILVAVFAASGNGAANVCVGSVSSSPVLTFTEQVKGNATVGAANAYIGVWTATVPNPTPYVTTTSLNEAAVGNAYSFTLGAASGTPAYTWSISSGSLPGWASLNSSTGVITGTPAGTDIGTTTFTVEVTDSNSLTGTQVVSLSVVPVGASDAVTFPGIPGLSTPGADTPGDPGPGASSPPTSGPVFYPRNQALRARLPQQPFLRGHKKIRGSKGAPVVNPTVGPVFHQRTTAVRAQLPLPQFHPKGRVISTPKPAAGAPSQGPVFRQKTSPVRFVIPAPPPRRGRIGSSFGAPVVNPAHGPPVYPLHSPVKARQPLPLRGKCRAISPITITIPVAPQVFISRSQPSRITPPEAPRGRISFNKGAPVHNPATGPVFRQATAPIRAHVPQTFSKGRIGSSAGAPVINPKPGPAFRVSNHPVRAEIPAAFSKGRVSGNPGGPVRNPVALVPFHGQGLIRAKANPVAGLVYESTLIAPAQGSASSISYNTGTTASVITSVNVNLTIPSGVLVNDLMVMAVTLFTTDASEPSVSITGGTWTLVSTTDASANPQVANGSGVFSYDFAYIRTATGIDPGATITLSETGSGAGATWWSIALASYTGAAAVDVAGGANAFGGGGTTVTSPGETTVTNNDWAVYLGGGAPGGGSSFTVPAGTTTRQSVVSAAGVGAVITDSNGPVSSGSGIGGGTFGSSNPAATVWLTAFTTGISPQISPAGTVTQASQFFTRRIGFSWGAPIQNPASGGPAPALHYPIGVRHVLPVRGRISSNPGSIPVVVTIPAVFVQKPYPARIRPSLPPRGRIYSHAGAPVKNVTSGPVFRQLNHPARAVIPKNVARGAYAAFEVSAPIVPVSLITFNTGATATADEAVSVNLTIPSGVLAGDVMLLAITCFSEDVTAPVISFSGGPWNLIGVSTGTNPEVASGSGVTDYGYAYYRVATAADPGSTLTISETGSPFASTWFAVSIASYTGATSVDIAGGASAQGSTGTTVTLPVELTNFPGDWAVYLGGGGIQGSFTIPAGSTQREAVVSDAGVGTVISDSNGSAGPAGTSIGGGTFGASSPGEVWVTGFTVGLAASVGAIPRQQYAGYYGTGRIQWSPGAAVENPQTPGPPVYPLHGPIQAKALPRRRGICRTIKFIPLGGNPTTGPQFYPATSPIAAKLPKPFLTGRVERNRGGAVKNPVPGTPFKSAAQPFKARQPLPPRGRISSNRGAPVHNPAVGPKFSQATQPARTRITLPPRGRIAFNRGAPNIPVTVGPVFHPADSPIRARIPQNAPRGRIYSHTGAPVGNPQAGPNFHPAVHPAQARFPLPPRGRIYSNPGAPVHNPVIPPPPVYPQGLIRTRITLPPRGRIGSGKGTLPPGAGVPAKVYPLAGPVRIHPQLPLRGRISSNQGIKPPQIAPVYPLHGPVRAALPLAHRGRIGSNPGVIVAPTIPPKVYPLKGPVQARRPLPPHGRVILGNKGAPVHNPTVGPKFNQAVHPIRSIVPQNAPRGRTSSNPGGPIENPSNSRAAFWYLGRAYERWDLGMTYGRWQLGRAYLGESA